MSVRLHYEVEAEAQDRFASAYAMQAQACRIDPLADAAGRLAGESFYLDIASKYRDRAEQYRRMAEEYS